MIRKLCSLLLFCVQSSADAKVDSNSTQQVVQFDSLTKLDNWKTAILLKIRNTISEGTGLT